MIKEDYLCVVTARSGSVRLPDKNILPINGMSLAVHSVRHAVEAGLEVVLSTDIPILKDMIAKSGYPCKIIKPPKELADGNHHKQQVEHAITGYEDRNIILLQPTSPFRPNKLIERCIRKFEEDPSVTCITGHDTHHINSEGVIEKKQSIVGNVIIYPPDKLFNYENHTRYIVHGVELIEIDTYDDYVRACIESIRFEESLDSPVAEPYLSRCVYALRSIGFGGEHNLVLRGDDIPRQDLPTMYVNSCAGYDGGRVDAITIVANKHILTREDTAALSECIDKAKIIIIRNHQYVDSLLEKFPNIRGKEIIIERRVSRIVDAVTTGALTQDILNRCGGKTHRFGYFGNGGQDRLYEYSIDSLHYGGTSFDTAIFNFYQ